MKSSTNRYLTALAIYDILYLTFALTMSFTHYSSISDHPLYVHYRAYVGRTLTNVWSNTGIWLTVTFTVERFIVVCCPMKGKVWCTPKRAKHTLAGVCLAAALITVPEVFSRSVTEKVDLTTNMTVLVEKPTSFGNSTAYLLGYQYANQVLFTFLPLVLLSIFNSLLMRALVTAAKQRDLMTNSRACTATPNARSGSGGSSGACPSQDQQRITLMLVCIVIVFIVCQLPSAVAVLYMNFVKSSTTEERHLVLLSAGSVFNLLVMINSAVNFIFYSAFSSRFRTTFRRTFCRYRRSDASPDTQTTHFPHPVVNASPRTLSPSPYAHSPVSPSPRCLTAKHNVRRSSRDFRSRESTPLNAGSRDVSPCQMRSRDVSPQYLS